MDATTLALGLLAWLAISVLAVFPIAQLLSRRDGGGGDDAQ